MTCNYIFLIVLMVASSVRTGLIPLGGLEMTFEASKNCDSLPDGKIKMDKISLEQVGRNQMVLSGEMDFKVPLDENFVLKIVLTKCPSKTERGKCEDFPPSTIKDVCSKLPQKNQMWTNFVKNLEEFDPHCPVKVGQYKFHKIPMDMDGVASMPLMEGYWVMITEGYNGTEKLMCAQSEFSFKRKKQRG